jgi:hypothetical protein
MDHHWFELDQNFTLDEVRLACRCFNCHVDPRYPIANMLGIQLVLNNCKKELRTKIETQIEAVRADEPQEIGGLLALYYVRQAVIQASQEYAEQLVDDLKNFKVSDVVGENVDEAVRILRHTVAILRAANQLPANMAKKLMYVFQRTSVPSFNAVFDVWYNTSTIADVFPTMEEVLIRAVSVYTSLHSKGKWNPPTPKQSQMHNMTKDADGKASPTTDAEKAAKKKEKNKQRRQKQKDKKKAKKAAAAQAETAAGNQDSLNVAAGMTSGSPGIERIRSFKINDVELKGDISPPLRSEQNIARSFQKTDGSGTMELWWCWKCGRGGAGLWRPHSTHDCPLNRQGAQDGGSTNQRVGFSDSVGMLSGPEIQAPTVRGLGG